MAPKKPPVKPRAGALECDEQIRKQERWVTELERRLESAKQSVKELTAQHKEAGIKLRQLINGEEEPLPFESAGPKGPRPAELANEAGEERRGWALGASGKDRAAGERPEAD